MSSTYRRICLSHNPPLIIDDGDHGYQTPPQPHPEHPDCVIALGRYSYPLIEIWLPIPDRTVGSWFDLKWARRFPQVLKLLDIP